MLEAHPGDLSEMHPAKLLFGPKQYYPGKVGPPRFPGLGAGNRGVVKASWHPAPSSGRPVLGWIARAVRGKLVRVPRGFESLH